MREPVAQSVLTTFIVAFAGSLLGAGIIAAIFILMPVSNKLPKSPASQPVASITAVKDYLDTVKCPRGLQHVAQIRGIEDGFAQTQTEPSRIEPSLLRFGSFRDAQDGQPRSIGKRDYDEAGTDKQLIDYFDFPQGAVSGELVLKLRAGGSGADNDFVKLIPSATLRNERGVETLKAFSSSISEGGRQEQLLVDSSIAKFPLANFVEASTPLNPSVQTPILAYLRQVRPINGLVSLVVSDDTIVDVAAMSWCVEPEIAQGVTFVEFSDKRAGADISMLSCVLDETQSFCNPYSGDTACTTSLPIACYKDGNQLKPQGLTAVSFDDAAFVGGEVRPSKPVAAARFVTRADADAFCASQFGQGWRVLSYQEGGGGTVLSRSNIAPKTRLWIDIADQPRGRCWDRPAFGVVASPNK